ncbi:MAG TPA: hypothetical protein VHL11_02505 [Phototrophicaceae bacterium]|nr:hypothetical protein [Phototrophicaceae bacterium]
MPRSVEIQNVGKYSMTVKPSLFHRCIDESMTAVDGGSDEMTAAGE